MNGENKEPLQMPISWAIRDNEPDQIVIFRSRKTLDLVRPVHIEKEGERFGRWLAENADPVFITGLVNSL